MKVKVEIVEGVFGHRSLYVHDYRVGGEKPWGGGKVVASFWVEAEDVSKALVRAVADDEADRVRSYSAAKLQALPVGTIVDAGVLPYERAEYKRVQAGWRKCYKQSKRAYGSAVTSATLAKLRARSIESEDT